MENNFAKCTVAEVHNKSQDNRTLGHILKNKYDYTYHFTLDKHNTQTLEFTIKYQVGPRI